MYELTEIKTELTQVLFSSRTLNRTIVYEE
jgi:hypothetical protein